MLRSSNHLRSLYHHWWSGAIRCLVRSLRIASGQRRRRSNQLCLWTLRFGLTDTTTCRIDMELLNLQLTKSLLTSLAQTQSLAVVLASCLHTYLSWARAIPKKFRQFTSQLHSAKCCRWNWWNLDLLIRLICCFTLLRWNHHLTNVVCFSSMLTQDSSDPTPFWGPPSNKLRLTWWS